MSLKKDPTNADSETHSLKCFCYKIKSRMFEENKHKFVQKVAKEKILLKYCENIV